MASWLVEVGVGSASMQSLSLLSEEAPGASLGGWLKRTLVLPHGSGAIYKEAKPKAGQSLQSKAEREEPERGPGSGAGTAVSPDR